MNKPNRVDKQMAIVILRNNKFTDHYTSKRNNGKYLHTFGFNYNSEYPYGIEVMLDSLNYLEEFNI